jgi:hypothetical protein
MGKISDLPAQIDILVDEIIKAAKLKHAEQNVKLMIERYIEEIKTGAPALNPSQGDK